MTALAVSYPLECQIVAQQVPATSSGIQTGLPARADRETTESASGSAPSSSGPAKMRFTQAG